MKKAELAEIVFDERCQCREQIKQDVVDEYAEAYEAGEKFPPLDVFEVGGRLVLVDGFHRWTAAHKAGESFHAVNVVGRGDMDQAAWHALTVNHKHGLRRTNADKRRAVMLAVRNPIGEEQSNRVLAEHCGVSDFLVRTVREDVEAGARKSQQASKSPKSKKSRSRNDGESVRVGKDGKRYKAKKAEPKKPKKSTAATRQAAGLPSEWAEVDRLLADGIDVLNEASRRLAPAKDHTQLHATVKPVWDHVRDGVTALELARPVQCPACRASGSACGACRKTGYVTKRGAEMLKRGKAVGR